jgi:peptidoglycan hydrolase-like protein with peptidoglycan-binding domain
VIDGSDTEETVDADVAVGRAVALVGPLEPRPADPDVDRDAEERRGRRRRWWWLLAVVAVVAVTAVTWVVASRVQSPEQAASNAAPPEASWVTAVVEQRVLTQTLITRGDVTPEVSASLRVPVSVVGDPVITDLAVAAGDEVIEGQRVIEVSGRPVFVLVGDVPVYRSLRPGMTGADVAQLQAALSRLGCPITDLSGVYGPETKACVGAFYADAGYEALPSSETEAADLAAAGKAVSDAQAAVDAADATWRQAAEGVDGSALLALQLALESARRSYNDAVVAAADSVAQADAELAAARTELDRVRADPTATPADISAAELKVSQQQSAADTTRRSGATAVANAADAVKLAEASLAEAMNPDTTAEYIALGQALATRDTATAALEALQATTGPTVAQGEIVFMPALPARVRTTVTTLGSLDTTDGSTGGGIVELSGGSLVVTMTLRADEIALARVGMPVALLDEQTSTSYPATITNIADNATTGPDGTSGYQATITPDSPFSVELTGSNLRVTIDAASSETETLVVPITAISSAADGTTTVAMLPAASSEPIPVQVTTGISADGFVAIEPVDPADLHDGDKVVVGR